MAVLYSGSLINKTTVKHLSGLRARTEADALSGWRQPLKEVLLVGNKLHPSYYFLPLKSPRNGLEDEKKKKKI
jgi:hypothetical protein